MEPKDLASQLRCPNGAGASDVARGMNEANRSVNLKCIDLLRLTPGDQVLELGPGNGAFVADIVGTADRVAYVGIDWSAEMVAESNRLNDELVAQGHVRFGQGSSDSLPFAAASFDKVLAVHTLYFWEHPGEHFAEILRTMKPTGLFCLAFGDRAFMKDLPFAPFGFKLYDRAEACALLRAAGFRVLESRQHLEAGRSNTGAVVNKVINIIVCDARQDAGPPQAC